MSTLLTLNVKDGTGRRYVARLPDSQAVATLQVVRPDPRHWIVQETEVPRALRGRGVSLSLAARVLADAAAAGARITALCPTFQAHVDRHPPWRQHLS